MTSDSIILIGASVRAAAQSAVRGGLTPWCADLFADQDLQAIATACRVRHYPAGLVAALAEAPADPLVYTGALENYPRLIQALTSGRPLWGNGSAVLRGVRNPQRLADALRNAGLPAPQVSLTPRGIPRDGTWLCKPLRSGGGWRIRPWEETALETAAREVRFGRRGRPRSGCYFQERMDGISCAALYVAADSEAVLLGLTRQWVGTEWLGAGPFCYAGSIGPDPLAARHETVLHRLGKCLAEAFQLEGLFGVDVIVNDQGVWPVEVNPRYPASAEVLERACGFSAIRLHVDACARQRLPSSHQALPLMRCVAGKAILFAKNSARVSAPLLDWAWQENQASAWPAVADVPHLGSALAAGSPVVTVLGEGADAQHVESHLRRQIDTARRLLEGS